MSAVLTGVALLGGAVALAGAVVIHAALILAADADHEHATEDIPANLAGPTTDAEWARLHAVVIQHREGDVDELLRRINKETRA